MSAIDDFLRLRTFFCPKLVARLTPEACVERQRSKDELVNIGRGRRFRQRWSPFDHFCQSGECGLGRQKKLGLKLERKWKRCHDTKSGR